MTFVDLSPDAPAPQPGQLLARGVARHLVSHGFACVEELVPTRGLRVDVMALGPKGEIWVVECKSSRADFTSDNKWQGYLEWADRFFWAVDDVFPTELLPDETGLIIADAYGGEILRMGPENQTGAGAAQSDVAKVRIPRRPQAAPPARPGNAARRRLRISVCRRLRDGPLR